MSNSAMREKWDARYRQGGPGADTPAARVLVENRHLLPAHGQALDLACGLGGNARLLAEAGLDTQAWDLSPTAIERLREQAHGLPLQAEVRDVLGAPPAADSFDVIVVSRFLERELCPRLAAALRPGGLLFYQTFVHQRPGDGGPRNPAFLLAENELLRLFAGLTVRVYREEGCIGDIRQGWRDEAMLVAQRGMD